MVTVGQSGHLSWQFLCLACRPFWPLKNLGATPYFSLLEKHWLGWNFAFCDMCSKSECEFYGYPGEGGCVRPRCQQLCISKTTSNFTVKPLFKWTIQKCTSYLISHTWWRQQKFCSSISFRLRVLSRSFLVFHKAILLIWQPTKDKAGTKAHRQAH